MVNAIETSLAETYLDQLLQQLNSFKSLLEQEASVLKTLQPDPLVELGQQKATLSEQIETSYQQLMLQLSPETRLSLAEIIEIPLFGQFSKSHQQKLTQALQLSQQCHSLNLSNGMTIQALSNLNKSILHMFTGQDQDARVYGAQGKTKNSQASKPPLGTA